MIGEQPCKVVVLGHGPVGYAFIEQLVNNSTRRLRIQVISECRYPAFNRVMMTTFFRHRSVERLEFASREWYKEHGIEIVFGKATSIDRKLRLVHYDTSSQQHTLSYDELVFATGSSPFVPPIHGLSLATPGIFVYRTITDMEKMIQRAPGHHSAAVIGGGLLGLEAAKALQELGLKVHVLEVAPQLLPTQIGQSASELVRQKVEQLGVTVHTKVQILEVLSNAEGVNGVRIQENGAERVLDVCVLVVSAGVRPRDELARSCGLEIGQRGGVKVDSRLRSTTDDHVYAIGEVASYNGGMVYGLWAPGVEQARVLSCTLGCPEKQLEYHGSDLSTNLKLLGVNVASFGADPSFWTSRLFDIGPASNEHPHIFTSVASDANAGVCRRLIFKHNPEDQSYQLLGGVLVGDVEDYLELRDLARSGEKLWGAKPAELTQGENLTTWQSLVETLPTNFMQNDVASSRL
jgi:nitrite reductase (NADH) large subunit|eukprot:CAMPEP_0169101612 /NCGR_PEP_ID=MMETSP1015-20121227/21724_1 /TAXON_ID=342587 /ORGANISM="Karlodinium micrum, Strain CCMP2283" /LENGTH=461 /DNA_ID=CAMNT_0009162653 /DNA_START=48 /DNA_END=1433 /DNA_ORIENTATION=+